MSSQVLNNKIGVFQVPLSSTSRILTRPLATEEKGFMDRIRSTVTEKVLGGTQEEKQAAAYRDQVASMVAKKDFTLVDFRTMLTKIAEMAGATGWKSYLPGASSQADVVEIKKMLNVIENLSPTELENPDAELGRRSKIALSHRAKTSVQHINQVLNFYEQMKLSQQWLYGRKAAGQRLPDNEAESTEMMIEDKFHQKASAQQQKKKKRR